jgi:zinc finger protein 830
MSGKTTSKVDKNELKRLMREEKGKKIESPLAKYNSIGQLLCVICNQVIKSELFWSAHVNSKSHLQQIEALKTTTAKSKAAATKVCITSTCSFFF